MKKYFSILFVLFISLFMFNIMNVNAAVVRSLKIENCADVDGTENDVKCDLTLTLTSGDSIAVGDILAFNIITKNVTNVRINLSTMWDYNSEGNHVTNSTGYESWSESFVAKQGATAGSVDNVDLPVASITYTKASSGTNCYLAVSMAKCKPWTEHDGLYFDSNGNVVDETAYNNDSVCNPPDDDEPHVCEIVTENGETTYYGPDGTEVTQQQYNDLCRPSEIKRCFKDTETGKFYGSDGSEVTEEEFNDQCNPKCKVDGDNYYDDTGKPVTQEEYIKACKPYKCVKVGNTYYNNSGEEITEDEFNEICKTVEVKKCYKDKDTGKFYGKDGIEVTEDDYNKECIDNPPTGLNVSIAFLVIVGFTSIFIYEYTKKKDKLFN